MDTLVVLRARLCEVPAHDGRAVVSSRGSLSQVGMAGGVAQQGLAERSSVEVRKGHHRLARRWCDGTPSSLLQDRRRFGARQTYLRAQRNFRLALLVTWRSELEGQSVLCWFISSISRSSADQRSQVGHDEAASRISPRRT